MSQKRWIYIAPSRAAYRIGMYHGNKSGHVLIYVNTKILNIDFSILHSKLYSFLLEEQLCEISIDKQENGEFTYEFRVNKEVQTTVAREHKRIERRHLLYSILFLTIFILIIVLLTVFLR